MNKLRFTSLTKHLILFLAVAVSSLSLIAEAADRNARRVLIVYFSQPEDVKLEGVDGVSGASILQKTVKC